MDEHKLEGRRAVREALRASRKPERLYLLKNSKDLGELRRLASEAGAVISECERGRLDSMSETGAHQGVIAVFPAYPYAEPGDIFILAEARGERPFIIVCDGIEDERNLGAVIRSAEAFGAHGVVIPKRRSAGFSPVAAKAAAGAEEHIKIARVPGIPSYLRGLKEKNIWIYGMSADAEVSVYDVDFSGGCCLVVGSEGGGMSRLTEELCDYLLKIPLCGKIESLNVSAAAAVAMSCVSRQ